MIVKEFQTKCLNRLTVVFHTSLSYLFDYKLSGKLSPAPTGLALRPDESLDHLNALWYIVVKPFEVHCLEMSWSCMAEIRRNIDKDDKARTLSRSSKHVLVVYWKRAESHAVQAPATKSRAKVQNCNCRSVQRFCFYWETLLLTSHVQTCSIDVNTLIG